MENFSKAIDGDEDSGYNKIQRSRQAKYIDWKKLGMPIKVYVYGELEKIYKGIWNGVADEIAIEQGDIVYIVDSAKENGKVRGAVRRKFVFSDEKYRKEYIMEVNNDAVSKGKVSDELSSKIASKSDKYRRRNGGQESGEELSADQGESADNEGRVSPDNGDRGGIKKSKKIQHSYKGEHAEDADHGLLAQARELEADGVSSEDIRQRTGWFKSYDGKWRYEIDDSKMEFIGAEVGKETTLGKAIKHDELFKAYPQLKDVRFKLEELKNKDGQYDFTNNILTLSPSLIQNGKLIPKAKSLLIHEIQHAIQHIEGFARGGSVDVYKSKLLKERTRRLSIAAGASETVLKKIEKEFGDYGLEITRDYLDLLENPDPGEDYFNDLAEIEAELKDEGLYDLVNKYVKNKFATAEEIQKISKDAWDQYEKTAGEIEAYDVGDRVNFTPEQRKNTRPDVDQDKVFFSDDSHLNSVSDGNIEEPVTSINEEKMQVSEGDAKRITADMSDEERYEILKNKSIDVLENNNTQNFSNEVNSLEALNRRARSKAVEIIIPLAERLGIINRPLKTDDIDIEFTFSKNKGLLESTVKQLRYGGDYVDFAKALINLDQILHSAILIEEHKDKYSETKRENPNLDSVYVLFSAFKDGNSIIPVQLEIKKFYREGGRLYVIVALTKIEADVLGSANDKNNQARSLISASVYSIADIIKNVNPIDGHFLKYLPDQFLSKEQIESKYKALSEDKARIDGYAPAKKSMKFSYSGDRTRKTDGDQLEPSVNLPLLNRSRFKIYTKENAETIIGSIAHNSLNFNDGTQGIIKDKGELVDLMWKRLNGAEHHKRGGVALDLAEEVIKRVAVKAVYDDPNNAEYTYALGAIREYIHGFDLEGIEGELIHRFGKNQARGIMLDARLQNILDLFPNVW